MTVILNDTHSMLNRTTVREVIATPEKEIWTDRLEQAAKARVPMIAMGGRHAMGGQAFCREGIVLDTRPVKQLLALNPEEGWVLIQAGADWPQVIKVCQQDMPGWSIIQKPTGVDTVTLGGCLSSNVHGRGLAFAPMVQDVLAFELLTPDGRWLTCSLQENTDWFRLVIGGYGLFGMIYAVKLRLMPKITLMRQVQEAVVEDVVAILSLARDEGALFGDFQVAINRDDPGFLTRGILSYYLPVTDRDPQVRRDAGPQKTLGLEEWQQLVKWAHTDPEKAFKHYTEHYLATHGQRYASDTHQLSTYLDHYHQEIDTLLGHQGSEMITELYVPRVALPALMTMAAKFIRQEEAQVIYSTVRLIEPDTVTALPWAKEAYACVVMNLHVQHGPDGEGNAMRSFRGLIEIALNLGGSFYLTYHRYAHKEQILGAYPGLHAFLEEKHKRDPGLVIQSDWFRAMIDKLE